MVSKAGFLFFVAFALALPALGGKGGWGSSEGAAFSREKNNPWFLYNVSEVRTCILVDRTAFSGSLSTIHKVLEQVTAYWARQFAPFQESETGLGSQKFIVLDEANCPESPDLKIVFGVNKLTEAEKKPILSAGDDFKNYLALTMQMDYDLEQMRGHGYIYVSADKGPTSYNFPQKENLQHEGVLYRLLLHEFGHIFGIPHQADGFMRANYPEKVFFASRDFLFIGETENFFQPPAVYHYKWPFERGNKETPVDTKPQPPLIGTVETKNEWKSFKMSSGNVSFDVPTPAMTLVKQTFPITIYLPEQKKVFPSRPAGTTIKGPPIFSFKLMGETTINENKESILAELFPDHIELYMTIKGQLNQIIPYKLNQNIPAFSEGKFTLVRPRLRK
jgi:hypothetical protein